MTAAITFVLREHDFRAGRFRLGYQSCDDSTAQTGVPDPRKCTSNANAWVHHPLVIGVIGPYTSGCAISEIPIANRARTARDRLADEQPRRAHPLRPARATRPARPAVPDRRPQLRACLPQRRPAGSGDGRVRPPTQAVRACTCSTTTREASASTRPCTSRPRPGDSGCTSPDPAHGTNRNTNYTPLAAKVAGSGASAVYLGASGRRPRHRRPDPRAAPAARRPRQDPHQRDLHPRRPVVPICRIRGARASTSQARSLPPEPLGPAGRQFATRFAATQHGAPVNQAALYAAQATELMIDAIAHSDGTRAIGRPSPSQHLHQQRDHRELLRRRQRQPHRRARHDPHGRQTPERNNSSTPPAPTSST